MDADAPPPDRRVPGRPPAGRRPTSRPAAGSLPPREGVVAPTRRVRPPRPLQPLMGLAWATIALLGASALADLVNVVWAMDVLKLATALETPAADVDESLTAAAKIADHEEVIGYVRLAVLVVTGVVFLIWFARAHGNLGRRGLPKLQFSPGWAVGGFFVPLLNLFRPFEVMSEVWKGSHTLGHGQDRDRWRSAPGTPWLGAWWALWLVGGILGAILVRVLSRGAPSVGALRNATYVEIAASLLHVGAAVAAAMLVKTISTLQAQAPEHDGAALGEVFS